MLPLPVFLELMFSKLFSFGRNVAIWLVFSINKEFRKSIITLISEL